MSFKPAKNPPPTPEQRATCADLVAAFLKKNFPVYVLVNGTWQEGNLTVNRNRIEYVFSAVGATAATISEWLAGRLNGMRGQFPPQQTPLGLDWTAVWDAVNGKFHGAMWDPDMKNYFIGTPGAGDPAPKGGPVDVPNVPVLDATDVAEEIYQRTLNEPPVYANGFEVCNSADWFRTWKAVAQQSYAKLLGDEWAGVPLETRHVVAYYLWLDTNAPGPRENPIDADHPFYGPLTAAELAGMDPTQLVAHVGKGNGMPSGAVPV